MSLDKLARYCCIITLAAVLSPVSRAQDRAATPTHGSPDSTAMQATPADTAVNRFVVSSETCSLWREMHELTPESKMATEGVTRTCAALPTNLSDLRKAHVDDKQLLQRLGSYDEKTGETHASWPKDVAAFIKRSGDCEHFAGEFSGGDSPFVDQEANRNMDRLQCNRLKNRLDNLRRRYANEMRVSTRLSFYDDDGRPASPAPEDITVFLGHSQGCATQSAHDPYCAKLVEELNGLKKKYESEQLDTAYAWRFLVKVDWSTGLLKAK